MTTHSKRLGGALGITLLMAVCLGSPVSASDFTHMALLRQGDALTCQPCDFSGAILCWTTGPTGTVHNTGCYPQPF